ncbi:hypothetical protein BH24ACT2_BH24ACT2_07710 [soil metagenome]
MSRGQHAADDNSFNKSAGGALLRGVLLVAVAVVLGVVLLQVTDRPEPLDNAGGDPPAVQDATTTTVADDESPPVTPTTIEEPFDPSTITVLVANGAGVGGLAGDVTDIVAEADFETAPPTDVSDGEDVEQSVVYFAPSFQEAAMAVAAEFDPVLEVAALPDPPPVADLAGANVVLVAGPDLVPEE